MKKHRILSTFGLVLLGIMLFIYSAHAKNEDIAKEIEKEISIQLGAQFELKSWDVVKVRGRSSTLERSTIKITAITKEALYRSAGRDGNGQPVLRVTKAAGETVEFEATLNMYKPEPNMPQKLTQFNVLIHNPQSHGQPLNKFPSNTTSSPVDPPTASDKLGVEKSALSGQNSEKAEAFDKTKVYKSVYEKCESDKDFRNNVICDCLAEKVVELYAKQSQEQSGQSMDILIATIETNGSCRNVPMTTRIEYEKCMSGSGFDYENIPQKDYCECYARNWAELFGEFEGGIDSYRKSSIRGKARSYCLKPDAYK